MVKNDGTRWVVAISPFTWALGTVTLGCFAIAVYVAAAVFVLPVIAIVVAVYLVVSGLRMPKNPKQNTGETAVDRDRHEKMRSGQNWLP